jgi:tRNA(fMet)-specific endonuclease VapC
MLKAMLDANLCIRVLRDRPGGWRERFKAEASWLAISTIVFHELRYGAERSDRPDLQRTRVDEFAAHISVLDFDNAAAIAAADIKANLAASGKLIGPNDLLIAGHARSRDLILVTGNLGEFARVQGLRCEDWS